MVANKGQPSSKDQAHHTNTTTTSHYILKMKCGVIVVYLVSARSLALVGNHTCAPEFVNELISFLPTSVYRHASCILFHAELCTRPR